MQFQLVSYGVLTGVNYTRSSDIIDLILTLQGSTGGVSVSMLVTFLHKQYFYPVDIHGESVINYDIVKKIQPEVVPLVTSLPRDPT